MPYTFWRAVWHVLSNTYHDRWTGRGGPTAWPPRSSAFLPVRTPKHPVYVASVDNEEALHRTVDTCQAIRNYPGIFEWMRRSMMRRVEAYIESHGGHVSRHVLIWTFFVLVCGTGARSLSAPFSCTLYTRIKTCGIPKTNSLLGGGGARNVRQKLKIDFHFSRSKYFIIHSMCMRK
jgi:hypothetical protein